MRILRVVCDYWPCVGGNERWSFLHDRWFSDTAGDEVQTLVLRPSRLYATQGYREPLSDYRFEGALEVPGLPAVSVHQEILPDVGGVRLAWEYVRRIRPWIRRGFDVVITQIAHHHAYFAWGDVPLVYEPTTARLTWIDRRQGLAGRMRFHLTRRLFGRFDLVPASHLVAHDLERLGLDHKVHRLGYLVEPSDLNAPIESEETERQRRRIDDLASRYPHVLMQINRLIPFKGPHRLLDIAESLPECAVVFAGDGSERPSLERRIRESPSLHGRVELLGHVSMASMAHVAERVSAFVMTSTHANYNTVLYESMALGIGPVAVVDTGDLPPEAVRDALILPLPSEPSDAAERLAALLDDPARRTRMTEAASEHVRRHNSGDQMWGYRARLMALAGVGARHEGVSVAA